MLAFNEVAQITISCMASFAVAAWLVMPIHPLPNHRQRYNSEQPAALDECGQPVQSRHPCMAPISGDECEHAYRQPGR